MLFDREHGRYHRRTFPEIIKLMDFFSGRARTRVLSVVHRA
jgi:hypothetical protein